MTDTHSGSAGIPQPTAISITHNLLAPRPTHPFRPICLFHPHRPFLSCPLGTACIPLLSFRRRRQPALIRPPLRLDVLGIRTAVRQHRERQERLRSRLDRQMAVIQDQIARVEADGLAQGGCEVREVGSGGSEGREVCREGGEGCFVGCGSGGV